MYFRPSFTLSKKVGKLFFFSRFEFMAGSLVRIVRNDGATPRSPRGCLGSKVAPLAASGQQPVKRIRFVAAFHGIFTDQNARIH